MEVPLPALLLLLVARALASNNDGSCLAANNVLEEMPKTIQNLKENSTTLYVMPEQGFRGVILETRKGNEVYNASFAISEECYDDSGLKWNELRVGVKPHPFLNPTGVVFEVRIGECAAGCLWDGLTGASNLAVVSDGNSRWRYSSKLGCDIIHVTKDKRYRQGLCSDPPYNGKKTTTTTTEATTTTPTTTSTTTTITTAAAAIITTVASAAGGLGGGNHAPLKASGSSSPSGAVAALEKVSFVVLAAVVVVVVATLGTLAKKLLQLGPPPRLEVAQLSALPGGPRGASRGQEEAQVTVNELYEPYRERGPRTDHAPLPATPEADHHHHPAARHDSVRSVVNHNYHI